MSQEYLLLSNLVWTVAISDEISVNAEDGEDVMEEQPESPLPNFLHSLVHSWLPDIEASKEEMANINFSFSPESSLFSISLTQKMEEIF